MNGPKTLVKKKTIRSVTQSLDTLTILVSLKSETFFPGYSFEFTNTDTETVHKVVMSLNSKKSTSGEISPKILQSANICSYTLKNSFNHCLDRTFFPESLKCATITPVFKEGDPTSVKNYRPISILPTVSKVFVKIIANQLSPFLENCFSPWL